MLLTEAAVGPVRRWIPGSAGVKAALHLAVDAIDDRSLFISGGRDAGGPAPLGRTADSRLRADSVRAADELGAGAAVARVSAHDQQVLRHRSRSGSQLDRVSGEGRPAGV